MRNAEIFNMHDNNETIVRYTPRQLINHHIRFPEQPITDIDIENLIVGSSAVKLNLDKVDSRN